MRSAERIHLQCELTQHLVLLTADEIGRLQRGERQVVTAVGLRGGREDRLGQPLGLAQTRRHRVPEHRSGALVVGPRGTEEESARDALEAHRLRGLHQHRATGDVGPGGLREVGGVRRHEVVRDDAGGLVEPERRQCGEHAALVGDEVVEHDVEHRDAVGRDHEHAVVIDLVELADLARIVVRERDVTHGASSASTARAACATARSRSKQASSRSCDRCAVISTSSPSTSRNGRRSAQVRVAARCTMR